MTDAWPIVLWLIASYLIGSVPTGLVVSRLRGVDIRRHGSGNLGSTNIGRVLGKRWGTFVLLLDVAKGALTSVGAYFLFLQDHPPSPNVGAIPGDIIWLGTGLCCIAGNTAPFYLKFKGGKGVATALGVVLGIYPYLTPAAVIAVLIWAAVRNTTRYVSLASILASCSLPISFLICAQWQGWPIREHYPLLALAAVVAVVIALRHRSNIGRLLAGTENKVERMKV